MFRVVAAIFLASIFATTPALAQEAGQPDCNPLDERFTQELIEELEETSVSQSTEFDCKPDWVRTEEILQWLLPIISEASFGDYLEPNEVHRSFGIRHVVLAYGQVQNVRSVLCYSGKGEYSWSDPVGIEGIASEAQFFGYGSDQDRGVWKVGLTASDCDFFRQLFEDYDPDDIIHKKAWASPSSDPNEIIIVSGRSFFEFLDDSIYSVKLRPGSSRPADPLSEEAEKMHRFMLRYFAQKARGDGEKTDLPGSKDQSTGD